MALPVNINELIHGSVVEWERIEFKEGWNPKDVLHTICAFANDFNNWGGGYIIIGIAERDKYPTLPPKGLTQAQLSKIQKELLGLSKRIHPGYSPIAEPAQIDGKLILILWVPGGQIRPYKAPESLSKGAPYAYYIRKFNNTIKATGNDETELLSLAAKIPFDDRISHHCDITDLKLPLIQDFLKDIGSELYKVSGTMDFEQLCKQMVIIDGPSEYLKPRNVGLLFFNDHPENSMFKFFHSISKFFGYWLC